MQMLLALLSSPNLASRRPLFEQYDAIVQSRTVRRPEQADAAVLALDPPPAGPVPALAVSIDGNGRRVAADPYRGTVAAVLECASNLACVGAEPLGTTNNLNFGNPEKGHIAWQLTESVRGLGDACRALAAPIVGGNVSLYNEGATGPIYPTPVIGMVGRLPDARRAGRLGLPRRRRARSRSWGLFSPSLGACELAKLRGEPLPDGLAGVRPRRGPRRADRRARRRPRGHCCRAPTTSPRAGSRSRWPSAAWPERGCDGRLGEDFWEAIAPRAPGPRAPRRLPALLTAALFGEGSGRVRRQRRARRPARPGRARDRVRTIGTVGGEALAIGHRRRGRRDRDGHARRACRGRTVELERAVRA